MMSPLIASELNKLLIILLVLTAALIITRRDLLSLVNIYASQSFLVVLMSLLLYFSDKKYPLLIIAIITLLSKVILIPLMIRNAQKQLKIKRDVEFHYLTPIGSIFASGLVFFFVYTTLSKIILEMSNKLFLLTASLSVSLVFMGLIIIFTRKQTITNIIGYLTMENGALLFGLFVSELPLIIDIIIILDLLVLVGLLTIFAFGIDTSIEEFHNRLDPLAGHKGEE